MIVTAGSGETPISGVFPAHLVAPGPMRE